jgi:hypothetical protein
VLPFRWTNDILTKPIYCMTLSQPLPTNPFGLCPGWPRCQLMTSATSVAATVVAKPNKPSQTGTTAHKQLRHSRLMAAHRARVARSHNLPSLEAPARGMTIDRNRTPHKASVAALVSSIRWHYDMIQPMEVVVVINTGSCHLHHLTISLRL